MARFKVGQLLVTPHARDLINRVDLTTCLFRHMNGDWGELCQADKEENELSLKEGFRLLSSYRDRYENRFWIVTEADRSSTTIMLPDEY